jgi:ABC-type transport system substrate-binding protein
VRKQICCILAAMIVATGIMGCSSKEANSSAQGVKQEANATTDGQENSKNADGGAADSIVRVAINADPMDLSPFAALGKGRNAVTRTLYEYLIDRDGFGGDMIGVLAESVDKVDNLVYDLTLYDYIYDTEGNHLTASDVAFSYNKGKELGNLPKLQTIEKIEAIDEYVVEFTFSALNIGDLEILLTECPIVTQAAYEASPDSMATTPVGTTAYKVSEYTSGSVLKFEKTGNYWQKEELCASKLQQANVDKIEYDIITEGSQISIALETGSVDVSVNVTNSDLKNFQEGGSSSKGFHTYTFLKNPVYNLLPNCEEGNVMSNEALRKAVFYAIDNQGVLQSVFNGVGEACKGFGTSKYADYCEKWAEEDYFDYNLETAKQYLEQSGYKEGEVTLRFLLTSESASTKMAEVLQAYLGQIGINVEINAYDNALYNSYRLDGSNYDVLLGTNGSTDYVMNIWPVVFDSTQFKNGKTINNVDDPKLQELLKLARTVHTPESVDNFQQYLNEHAYGYAICTDCSNVVYNDKISQVMVDSRGFVMPFACEYTK